MDSTTLAYVAGFLDGDGSIFFQIVRRKDYRRGFQIRSSIAFYQKTECRWILRWLKKILKAGYIRHRKTGMSDYTVVEPKEVKRILLLLKPHVKLKRKQVELGLRALHRLENIRKDADFLAVCGLVDEFGLLNYSKKRKNTHATVSKAMPP